MPARIKTSVQTMKYSEVIFENFYFRSHLPQNLKLTVGQTGTALRAGYRSRDALQREIPSNPFYIVSQKRVRLLFLQ